MLSSKTLVVYQPHFGKLCVKLVQFLMSNLKLMYESIVFSSKINETCSLHFHFCDLHHFVSRKVLSLFCSMVYLTKMQAASQGIQPSTPSSRGHWPILVSPLPWSLSAWLTMKGSRMAWLWASGTEAGAWCGTQQLWTLRATIKTLPDRLVLQPQKLRSQNTKNIMTSKVITTFNQWQLRPLVCMASPLPLFWVVFRKNLLMCLATPGSASGSTSVCPWLWPGEMHYYPRIHSHTLVMHTTQLLG